MRRVLPWILVIAAAGLLPVLAASPADAVVERVGISRAEVPIAGGDTNPPTPGDEPPPPTVPEGSDSRWFAIVLYVLFGAAGIALVFALVRRPSQRV